jgi:hypothetical protein
MDLHLDPQNFIGYESAYETYKFLIDSHFNPPGSDSLTALYFLHLFTSFCWIHIMVVIVLATRIQV